MIDPNDIDGLAAEYVIGTADANERRAVDAERASNAVLDKAVTEWDARLAPLLDTMPDVEPSPELFRKIEQRLFGAKLAASNDNALQRWRMFAIAACIALAIMTSVTLNALMTSKQPQAVAVLQKDGASPAFLVSLDEQSLTLTVRALGAKAPENKDYELWIIEGKDAPRSLGVLPSENIRQVKLTGERPDIVRGSTLAVSLEPIGGSPTGKATGPVVFIGKFADVGL
jgi:hypothetical protein